MNAVMRTRINLVIYSLFQLSALMVFFVPFSLKAIALGVALYAIRMFGITAGYHRYFSHRAYKTSRFFQFCLAWLGASALQKGPMWWAAHHRHHHRFSDQPEDVHSPIQHGFWRAHWGWLFCPENDATDYARIPDLVKFPELRFIDRYYVLPPLSLALLCYALLGWSGVVWGFCVSTIFLYHGTYFINSLAHVFGRQRYRTGDTSRNNFWLALITLGEGWHNNHHYYQLSARQGFFWWEIDVSYYVLKIFSWMHLVWDLKLPPREVKLAHRQPELTIFPQMDPITAA